MKRTVVLVLMAAATAAGCGEEPIITPVRNLERPADMSFVCLAEAEVGGQKIVTGRPMALCRPPEAEDVPVDLSKPRTRGTFGFLTNTARGELAVIDLDADRLVDLDPANFGYNQLPLGQLPETITASQDGCRALSANRASCDFSMVDPARLLASKFAATTASTGPGPAVTNVRAKTASGELLASPHEVVFLPTPVAAGEAAPVCGTDGIATPEGARPWRAIVTFPRCDLVALIDFPSGQVVDSVRITAEGVERTGTNPVCPVECGSGVSSVDAGAQDAAPGDAGAGAPGALRVSALAVVPDGSRAYVGAVGASFVTSLPITNEGFTAPARRVPLSEGAGGVTRLRLSLDPFRTGPNNVQGKFVGRDREFLYAFARDGSVRVLDIQGRNGMGEQECDVNVDSSSVESGAVARPCFPVSTTGAGWRRRTLAEGPGIRVPVSSAVEVAAPVPRDIAFIERVGNAYGYLLASNGEVYLIYVGGTDALLTNSFVTETSRSNPEGEPLVVNEPSRTFSNTDLPFANKVTVASRSAGPRIEGFRDPDNNPIWVVFPDKNNVPRQDVNITWEGALPGSARLSGSLRLTDAERGQSALTDLGADFCRAGAQAGDVVALVGCNDDDDCDPSGTAVCYRSTPGAPGLCFPKARAKDDALMRACSRHLGSRRRYEVLSADRSRLSLGLKVDEIPRPTITGPGGAIVRGGCSTDADCRVHPTTLPSATVPGDKGFQCLKPTPDALGRCVESCGTMGPDGQLVRNDQVCRVGTVCEPVGWSDAPFLCVEAPPPDDRCWPDPVRYRVQVGKGYLVSSSALPYVSPLREARVGASPDRCVVDESRPAQVGSRIPLAAPRCKMNPTSDSVTVIRPEGEAGPANPCLVEASASDDPSGGVRVKAFFENAQLRFVVTNLEDYVGDAAEIFFSTTGGFLPARVRSTDPGTVGVSLGVRIVTSPADAERPSMSQDMGLPPYLFVIDQGRTTTFGSRGQVLRLNPRPNDEFPSGRYDSAFTQSTFPIQ